MTFSITSEHIPKRKKLTGYSGIDVLLLADRDTAPYVRKIAQHPDQNVRLERQMQKQLRCYEMVGRPFCVPRILNHGFEDGIYYFDMEFIRGVDVCTFLGSVDFDRVNKFTENVIKYFQYVSKQEPYRKNSNTFFEALFAKLCELSSNLSCIPSEIFVNCFKSLNQLRSEELTNKGTMCHGDFTLENMIVTDDDRIWLIDFLDSPFEHFWQDICKIHQDLEAEWYLHKYQKISQSVLMYIRDGIWSFLKAKDSHYEYYHNFFLSLTLMRILPYSKSAEDTEFLLKQIKYYSNKIEA